MIIFFDKVEKVEKDLFVVQITMGPAEKDRNFPSVRVRLPMRDDEISTLSLSEIHQRALQKVPELLQSLSMAIDEGFQPSPLG
jgi:hypothetical protein